MRSEYRRKDEIEAEYYSTEVPTIYTKWNPTLAQVHTVDMHKTVKTAVK